MSNVPNFNDIRASEIKGYILLGVILVIIIIFLIILSKFIGGISGLFVNIK